MMSVNLLPEKKGVAMSMMELSWTRRKYGRGPKGEVWQYFEDLPDLMHLIRSVVSDNPLFFILSSYAIRASFIASHELARDAFSGMGGLIESGELLIKEAGSDRQISTSLFTRWSAGK